MDSIDTMDRDPVMRFWNDHCIYLPAMLGWFFFSAILSEFCFVLFCFVLPFQSVHCIPAHAPFLLNIVFLLTNSSFCAFSSHNLGSYNKYVFGEGHMNFPCPLLLTSIHFAIQWMFSHVACACFPDQLGAKRVDTMTWKEWAWISIPCGLTTALDVGLSNLSLKYITLTFYTMVKSSTPIFVLFWAWLFKIERITWSLIGVILVIAAGELMTVYGEDDGTFRFWGFMLCLTASVLSGLRWTLVQTLLQKLDPPLESTIVTMKILAPSMFFSMLVLSGLVEEPWTKVAEAKEQGDDLVTVTVLGTVGGSIAVAMILCEFWLILKASAIILMIGGVIKELTTISIGVVLFKDRLNLLNSVGVFIVFLGVISYKYVFHLQKKELQAATMEAIPTEEQYTEEDEFLDEETPVVGERQSMNETGMELMNSKYHDKP